MSYVYDDRPLHVLKAIADAACSLEARATPAQAAVHTVLKRYTRDWDADQRWAIAMELADTARQQRDKP